MKTDKNFKYKKTVKFTEFCNFERAQGKISIFKTSRPDEVTATGLEPRTT